VASIIPFSDHVVGLGLDVTTSVAHCTYGVSKRVGIMTTSANADEGTRVRLITQLLSLVDLSRDTKDQFLQAVCSQAGHQKFLLGMDKDLYFSLTMEQDTGVEMWINGFGGLYDVRNTHR
jgi:hypothetical protein